MVDYCESSVMVIMMLGCGLEEGFKVECWVMNG